MITLFQRDLFDIDLECTYPSCPLSVEMADFGCYFYSCLLRCEYYRSIILWSNIPWRVLPWPRERIDRSHSLATLLWASTETVMLVLIVRPTIFPEDRILYVLPVLDVVAVELLGMSTYQVVRLHIELSYT